MTKFENHWSKFLSIVEVPQHVHPGRPAPNALCATPLSATGVHTLLQIFNRAIILFLFSAVNTWRSLWLYLYTYFVHCYFRNLLECRPMPNVMAGLPNIGGTLCSMPQSLADAQYSSGVQLCCQDAKPMKLAGVPQTARTISADSGLKFTIL